MEIKHCLQLGLTLAKKYCAAASTREQKWQMLEILVAAEVHLCSTCGRSAGHGE